MLQPRVLVLLLLIGVIATIIIKQFYLFKNKSSCHHCPPSAPCCSKWGFCGSTEEYCGAGCQSGPCMDSDSSNTNNNNNSIYIITKAIFQCAFPLLNDSLLIRCFQSLQELQWSPINKTEAAIFLSHVSHETHGLQTYVEYCQKTNACSNYQDSWCSIQAKPDRQYYGRGWFQLSYPCNYWTAGQTLGFDLLSNPDLVAQSDRLAAATAFWYYKTSGMDKLALQGDFAGTTRLLNKYECKDNPGQHLQASRVNTYQRIRQCFELLEATNNLYC